MSRCCGSSTNAREVQLPLRLNKNSHRLNAKYRIVYVDLACAQGQLDSVQPFIHHHVLRIIRVSMLNPAGHVIMLSCGVTRLITGCGTA